MRVVFQNLRSDLFEGVGCREADRWRAIADYLKKAGDGKRSVRPELAERVDRIAANKVVAVRILQAADQRRRGGMTSFWRRGNRRPRTC